MAQQKGANAKILIGEQADISSIATAGFVMPINSISVRPEQNVMTAQTIQGSRNPIQPFRGNKNVSGELVVPVDSRAIWYWMQLMLGDPVTAGTESPYTHEFKIPTDQPYFTMEEQYEDLTTDKYMQFKGCKISSFAMEVGGDGELTATLGVLGSNFEVAATTFDGSPTTADFARVSNFQAALTVGGSTFSICRSLSLNMDMGIDPDQFVIGGAGVRGSLPEGVVNISGSMTVLMDDAAVTLMAAGIAATESSLKLTITAAATSVFEIEIQEMEFSVSAPAIDTPAGLSVTLNFAGYYANGSEASAVVVRLTNPDAHA